MVDVLFLLLFVMVNKVDILDLCFESVNKRIAEVNFAIKDADAALADDTKSSAGDKYETSREMVQQDLNRYQNQLAVANKDLDVLQKIDGNNSSSRIGLGSLVETNVGLYFIAISVGLIKVGEVNVFVISAASPIGQVLVGKIKADLINFNNKNQEILNVY